MIRSATALLGLDAHHSPPEEVPFAMLALPAIAALEKTLGARLGYEPRLLRLQQLRLGHAEEFLLEAHARKDAVQLVRSSQML